MIYIFPDTGQSLQTYLMVAAVTQPWVPLLLFTAWLPRFSLAPTLLLFPDLLLCLPG